MIPLAAFFALAVASDMLSVYWHGAREQRQLARLGLLSALLEILGWIPVWFAITHSEPLWALAAVVGSAVGAVWGAWRQPARDIGNSDNQQPTG